MDNELVEDKLDHLISMFEAMAEIKTPNTCGGCQATGHVVMQPVNILGVQLHIQVCHDCQVMIFNETGSRPHA